MDKPRLFACLLLLAMTFDAGAEDPVLRSDDILAQQREIRADMEARTDRYVDMPRSTRKRSLADQDRLSVLLEGKTDTSQLDPSSRDEVASLLASIDDAVNRTGGERLICTREARIGSNYMTRVCRTPSQIREQQAAGQETLGDEASRIKCNDKNGCVQGRIRAIDRVRGERRVHAGVRSSAGPVDLRGQFLRRQQAMTPRHQVGDLVPVGSGIDDQAGDTGPPHRL